MRPGLLAAEWTKPGLHEGMASVRGPTVSRLKRTVGQMGLFVDPVLYVAKNADLGRVGVLGSQPQTLMSEHSRDPQGQRGR